MRTGDQTLVKQINKSIVLTTVQQKSPISRAQISKDTGLNKATVSSLVSDLLEGRLVEEMGAGLSNGGRKPTMLFFNNKAGYAIGIDLGVNYVLGILTDLQGTIVAKINEPLLSIDEGAVFNKVEEVIEDLTEQAPKSAYGIVGIGVGVPGLIDNEGTILFAPNLEWKNVHLKQHLERKYELPVFIENEAKAGSHGEKRYGAGQGVSNFIYVSIGIGVGAGIFINDQLYKGGSGISGEVGHFTIEPNGRKCRCGNKGCWELYSSEGAMVEKTAHLFSGEEEVTIDCLIAKAKERNLEVLNAFDQVGEYIGIGLTNLINIFNPEKIIIGNRFAELEQWLRNPIERVFQQRLHEEFRDSFTLSFSENSIYSCALGSAAFSIETFFSTSRVTVV